MILIFCELMMCVNLVIKPLIISVNLILLVKGKHLYVSPGKLQHMFEINASLVDVSHKHYTGL